MHKVKSFFKFLIHSNIFISIAAVCFTMANALLLYIEVNHILLLLVHIFFSTWFIYQFSRLLYQQKMNEKNTEDDIYYYQIKHQKVTKITTVLSLIISGITFLFLKFPTQVAIVFSGFLSVVYALPLDKIGIKKRLRDIPFVKIFLIAITWTITAVLLPILETNAYPDLFVRRVVLLFSIQFIYLLFITLPFDINDIERDIANQTKTIATTLGARKSQMLCVVLFLIDSYLLYIFRVSTEIHIFFNLLLISLIAISVYSSHKISKTWIMFFYDGSMIAYFIGIFVLMTLETRAYL